jgi:hypothetical protein
VKLRDRLLPAGTSVTMASIALTFSAASPMYHTGAPDQFLYSGISMLLISAGQGYLHR